MNDKNGTYMDRSRQFHVGQIALSIGCIGLGAITLAYGDFALQWQPISASLPGFKPAVYLSAAALLAAGIGIQIKRTARSVSFGLCAYFALFWVLPHLIRLAPHLASIAEWLGFCEVVGALSGLIALYCLLSNPRGIAESWLLAVAQRLFGFCCIVFGMSHFVYARFTAEMIPAWFPARMALAYITGSAHLLAGIAILVGLRASLAALLEAIMMSLFVLLLHLPSLWASPPPAWGPTWRTVITPFFWATCLAGCAWLIAASLRDRAGSNATPP
ncbi:MAG TPA: DoxX family protein [Steroidobacteraceae bacterium]